MIESKDIPVIRCEGVRLRYPRQKKEALAGVSFQLKANTICGLLGRNAAGKTSLLSLLTAFRRPTGGRVTVFGEDPWENPRVAPRVAFVYITQDAYFISIKVKEALKAAATFRENWDGDFARHLVELFKIPEKKYVSSLSQGQHAALCCTIGLASRAPLTIFDEAYSGMDAVYRRIFADVMLSDFMEHPRTILFSTHYISEWDKVFSDSVVIDEGRVIAAGECDVLRDMGLHITGAADAVGKFSVGKKILQSRSLGNQKEALMFGDFSSQEYAEAEAHGLTVKRPSLQDLFVGLTRKEGEQDVF
jgi:ABC-2 type transport system ATP-binding protein